MSDITFQRLDVRQCRRKGCRSYMDPALVDTVHPHHSSQCELHPNNAWPGYVLVKVGQCNPKVGYHPKDAHSLCLGCREARRRQHR